MVFVKHTSGKGFVSKVYQKLSEVNNMKISNLPLTEEDTLVVNKQMKRCLTLSVTGKYKLKPRTH